MEKLQVPENITLRWEAWRGVGKWELTAILSCAAISSLGGAIFCALSSAKSAMLIAVFAVVMITAFACGFFSKLDNNQSIYDYFRRQTRYKREQQKFYYVKGKEVYRLEAKEES